MSSWELEFEEGLFLYEMGLELVDREDWNGALSRFERALEIFERMGSKIEISLCLKALAKIYGYLRRWLRAAECFEKDLEIQRQVGSEQEVIEDIENLVNYYIKSYNFEKAVSHLEQMHSIFKESRKQEEVVRVLGYLGQVYENMGDAARALGQYKMAFELGEKLDLPSTFKLGSKIRELTGLKKGFERNVPLRGREITQESVPLSPDEFQMQKFETQTVGGVQVEPQIKEYVRVLGELEEKSKEKLMLEREEIALAKERAWVPSREILREGLKLLLDITYSEFMEVNKEQVLRVFLGGEISGSEESELSRSLREEKIRGSPVEVLVLAPDFDISEPRGRLEIPLNGKSRVIMFRVIPKRVGRFHISLEFYHLGRLLRRTVMPVFVRKTSEEVLETGKKIELSLYPNVELDATLRIHRFKDRLYFHLFTRHAEELASKYDMFGVSKLDQITSERLQLQMRNLTFNGEHTQRVITILTEMGRKAYSLIPKSISEAIRFLNPRFLVIETEDLFLPFELAYDGEDFLCLKYCVGKRILSENKDFKVSPARIRGGALRTKLVIAEPKREVMIPEKEFLRRVVASGLLILDEIIEQADRNRFTKALSEEVDIIYLRCKGVFNEKEPNESKLILSEGSLNIKEIENLSIRGNPLIFADIREEGTAEKETGLPRFTGITAMAKAFLNSGALAFIGSLLRIPENLVSEIAMKFYEKIIPNGKPVGIIMREIKKELKQKYPGVLWATFNLYGDPTLKISPQKNYNK